MMINYYLSFQDITRSNMAEGEIETSNSER